MLAIFSHTAQSFSEAVFAHCRRGKTHAERLYRHWMQGQPLSTLEVEPQARPLIEEIAGMTDFSLPTLSRLTEEGGTVKYLLKLHDGLECESVIIPMRGFATLCISSQIGCRMGCTFCETGRMGLIRSMTTEEIVAQVYYATRVLQKPVRNIVFMGMGEPLDNFEAVMRAVSVLTDPGGLNFGHARITISTSGRVDEIDQLTLSADPALNLAVSVNAPNDAIRRKIMPVNVKWNMAALKEAMVRYCAHPRRQILIEYVLLKDVNDSLESADELAAYLQGLNVKVNLIPYNPQSRSRFAPPDADVQAAFLARMRDHGYLTMLRKTKGRAIMAACGQLGSKSARLN